MLWTTENAVGEVEVMHAWGRTAVVEVKGAWVKIDRGHISVGAIYDDPIIDGTPMPGYLMPTISKRMNTEFPGEHLQTISHTEIIAFKEEGGDINAVRVALVSMRGGAPVSLVFTCEEYADFDIQQEIAELKSKPSVLNARAIEYLNGFDAMRFRSRSFRAVF